jgi:hypothetical protein
MFKHGAAQDVLVSIFGNTDVTVTGGVVTLLVQGTIDGEIVTDFISEDIRPPGKNVKWKKSGTKEDLSLGDHKLDMSSGIAWNGGAIDDTVTVTSLYGVKAVPVPAAAWMGMSLLSGTAVASKLRRKPMARNSSKGRSAHLS